MNLNYMVEYRQQNLNKISFEGQDLTGSIFDRCNLKWCSFKNCIMENVTIDRCNCIQCEWTGVNMKSINFINSNVIDEPEYPEEPIDLDEEPIEPEE